MTVIFEGGPYDGLELPLLILKKVLHVINLRTSQASKQFIYMPAVADWPDVVTGRMRVEKSRSLHFYELISTPDGAICREDPIGGRYILMIQDAFKERKSPRDRDDEARNGRGGEPTAP